MFILYHLVLYGAWYMIANQAQSASILKFCFITAYCSRKWIRARICEYSARNPVSWTCRVNVVVGAIHSLFISRFVLNLWRRQYFAVAKSTYPLSSPVCAFWVNHLLYIYTWPGIVWAYGLAQQHNKAKHVTQPSERGDDVRSWNLLNLCSSLKSDLFPPPPHLLVRRCLRVFTFILLDLICHPWWQKSSVNVIERRWLVRRITGDQARSHDRFSRGGGARVTAHDNNNRTKITGGSVVWCCVVRMVHSCARLCLTAV